MKIKNLIKYTIGYSLYGLISLTLASFIYPIVDSKIKNKIDERPIRERERAHFIRQVGDQENLEELLKEFDRLTDINKTTELIVNTYNLHEYEGEIKKNLTKIPDIEMMSALWLYLLQKKDFLEKEGLTWEPLNVSILRKIDIKTLDHEYMHSMGWLGWDVHIPIFGYHIYRLNEGLTDYYTKELFGSIGAYNEERLFAEKLEEANKIIMEEFNLKYSLLAKCFFVDNSIKEFKESFDFVFGKDKFKEIIKSEDTEALDYLIKEYKFKKDLNISFS